VRQTEKGTWIDTEGQFADSGTEFVFDPRNRDDADQIGPQETEIESQETEPELEQEPGQVESQASLPADNTEPEDSETDEETEFLMKDGEVV